MSDSTPTIPKWREDFPVESETDDYITRRDFMRFLLLVSGGLTVGGGWVFAKSIRRPEAAQAHSKQKICDAGELQPGAWRVFHYPDARTPAILVRRQNGEYVSFLQKCTHLACPVQYARADRGLPERLACHCHNGVFDLDTGEGVSGPPRDLRPLTRVTLELRDGAVFAVGLDHPNQA